MRKNWAAFQENSLLGRSEDECRVTEYVLILRIYASVEMLNLQSFVDIQYTYSSWKNNAYSTLANFIDAMISFLIGK